MIRTLLVGLAAIGLLAAGTPQVERLGKTRAAIVLPDGPPIGSVVLIPGATTHLEIGTDGSSDSSNFVIRERGRLLDAGFAVVYLDDPSDLRPAIGRMRQIVRPVFLLATSNGTAIAARVAATYGADGPDGVVLTSTITRNSRAFNYDASAADVRRIAVPVLFVHNRNDACPYSPPSGIPGLMARFAPGADVSLIEVASDATMGDPCGPIAPHGYFGIEGDVVAKIVAWMKAHGAHESPR